MKEIPLLSAFCKGSWYLKSYVKCAKELIVHNKSSHNIKSPICAAFCPLESMNADFVHTDFPNRVPALPLLLSGLDTENSSFMHVLLPRFVQEAVEERPYGKAKTWRDG